MKIIDDILSKLVEKNKTPSVQYLHFDKDNIIHKFQGGFADLKNQKRVSDDTSYHVFSVTKTFTALAVLHLVEKGKINIDETACKYMPDFPYPGEITIRQLLAHTAGIPNPNPLSWIHLEEEHPTFDSHLFFKTTFNKNHRLKSKPNEKFSYSNLAYVLLGQLIERVSGMAFEKYLLDNILLPLDLQANELGFTIQDPAKHAKGYQKQLSLLNMVLGFFIDKEKFLREVEGQWKPFKNYYVNGSSYGGLISSATALMKYIQELLKPDGKLLSSDHKQMLFTEHRTNKNQATGMCLSWFKGQFINHDFYYHPGGGGGYYCEARIYPGLGLGSVILFNRSGIRDERFLDKVDKYIIPNEK